MSLFLCRMIHRLHYYPKSILGVSLLITILAFLQLNSLSWDMKILQLFSDETPSRIEAERFQTEFGGFGTLTLLSRSDSISQNKNFIQKIAEEIGPHVHLAEYKSEFAFFNENKLLYIRLGDLEIIRDRIFDRIHKAKLRKNPFIVPLIESKATTHSEPLVFDDLKNKYSSKLNEYLGSEDQKILVLRIYPKHDITDVESNSFLYEKLKELVNKHKNSSIQIEYTGGLLNNLISQSLVKDEITQTASLAVIFILAGLLIFFYRQPLVPLIATLPIVMAIVWTLGFASIVYGHINIISLVLGVILLGVGTDSVIHLLARYGEERRKGLGPFIAFENIILETGPTITLSSFTTAIGFFSLRVLPFEGLQEFGTLAGVAILFSWLSSMLVFPAILILLQKAHSFKVYGEKIKNHLQYEKGPIRHWGLLIVITILISTSLFWVKLPPKLANNLETMGFIQVNPSADKTLDSLNLGLPDPAIFRVADEHNRQALTKKLKLIAKDSSSLIAKILTFEDALPFQQEEKIEILDEIRELLSPSIMESLKGESLENAELIHESITLKPVELKDLPSSFKKKFQGKNEGLGQYTFVFPKHNTNLAQENLQFANEVREIMVDENPHFSTGKSILIADFIESTYPYLITLLLWTLGSISLLLIIEIGFKDCFAIIFSVLLALGFIQVLISLLEIPITPLNFLIFPLILGYCFDGVLHIHQRYREEATGSIPFVMRRTGAAIIAASITTASGYLGFAISDHPGLSGIGILALLGASASLIASFIILPAIIAWGDLKRLRSQLKLKG